MIIFTAFIYILGIARCVVLNAIVNFGCWRLILDNLVVRGIRFFKSAYVVL